jgi:hypothetical protein
VQASPEVVLLGAEFVPQLHTECEHLGREFVADSALLEVLLLNLVSEISVDQLQLLGELAGAVALLLFAARELTSELRKLAFERLFRDEELLSQ